MICQCQLTPTEGWQAETILKRSESSASKTARALAEHIIRVDLVDVHAASKHGVAAYDAAVVARFVASFLPERHTEREESSVVTVGIHRVHKDPIVNVRVVDVKGAVKAYTGTAAGHCGGEVEVDVPIRLHDAAPAQPPAEAW